MSEHSSPAPHPPRAMASSPLPDRVLALALLGVAMLAARHAARLEVPFAADPLGPKVFPAVIAALLGAASLTLLLRPGLGWESAGRPWRGLACILAMLAYAPLLSPLGFILATGLLCLVIARAFGGSSMQCGMAALVTAPALFLLLDRLLDLPLPRGPFGF
ncbi:tripartite tricarboxylate transporter TctB family protein [Pseudoroseomonas globiformis]|uniref:Tripartite tricarboxylate transporter TctB family protein n=1 Tax=Teichococcus globiformis TaxID=2307229 RepID=A0ABV7G3B5_9PROT